MKNFKNKMNIIKKVHKHSNNISKILNYKETLLKMPRRTYEVQQKFSEIKNVSIQLLKKPTIF